MRAKAFEPVTLVRSPMLTNSAPAPISTGSRPDSLIGGTAKRKWQLMASLGVEGRGTHRGLVRVG